MDHPYVPEELRRKIEATKYARRFIAQFKMFLREMVEAGIMPNTDPEVSSHVAKALTNDKVLKLFMLWQAAEHQDWRSSG